MALADGRPSGARQAAALVMEKLPREPIALPSSGRSRQRLMYGTVPA
jgi:hypothetical protein